MIVRMVICGDHLNRRHRLNPHVLDRQCKDYSLQQQLVQQIDSPILPSLPLPHLGWLLSSTFTDLDLDPSVCSTNKNSASFLSAPHQPCVNFHYSAFFLHERNRLSRFRIVVIV